MAHMKWCGKRSCSECSKYCSVDQSIPCSPDCENLQGAKINIKGCLQAKCEEVFYIFGMEDLLGEKGKQWDTLGACIIEKYGEVATYPYSV